MAAGDLVTLVDALARVGLQQDEGDAVARLVAATSAQIARWLGYDPTSRTYARRFHGRGRTALLLPDRPVTAVASVTVDGVAVPAGPTGFVLDERGVYLAGGGRFARGAMNVAITYTAGFDPVPADLQAACLDWLASTWAAGQDDERGPGVVQVRAGDTERRYQADGGALTDLGRGGVVPLPPSVYAALAPYRRVAPC